jgi:hypothetical protein
MPTRHVPATTRTIRLLALAAPALVLTGLVGSSAFAEDPRPLVATAPAPVPSATATATATSTPYVATLDPSAGTAGWNLEVSDAREQIVNLGDRIQCTVGGFTASTHYARARRRLPETDDFTARKAFTIVADVELPSDFYDRHESYVRLITTDNYPAKMRSTGAKVGAASGDEWRVGFVIYGGDELPRLVSEHENRQTLVLWQGTQRLPVGRHRLEIRFTPSQATAGSWTMIVDGVVAGQRSSVRTVPTTLATSEIAVTRVGACLDGAAKQTSRSMTSSVRSFSFTAVR